MNLTGLSQSSENPDLLALKQNKMKKILVTTDFSANSKAGIRFAIRWATKQKVELVFIHVANIVRMPRWTDSYYEIFAGREMHRYRELLEKFIAGIYKQMKVVPGKHSFVIIQGVSADVAILDYCRSNKVDYICISTRGAGGLVKIFGTNTGNLITKSKVPVLAVPKNYKAEGFKKILYATDFRNYKNEIKKVVDFAQPLKMAVDILHVYWPGGDMPDENALQKTLKQETGQSFRLRFIQKDPGFTVIQLLKSQIASQRPSVVILFTNQERTFFQKLFGSSTAEKLSFDSKVPLLIFNKEKNP
jgi:nucleotide-binding universal stress UspA family protein